MTFDPGLLRSHESIQGLLCPSPTKIHKYVDTVAFFFLENLNLDPSMTFDPMSVEVTCVTLPKDHYRGLAASAMRKIKR